MNISTETGYGRYARLLKITAAIWLFAVSILAIINTVGLSRLDAQRQNTAVDARLQTLAERVEDIGHQFGVFEARQDPVSHAELKEIHQAFQKQIAGIEPALADTVKAVELEALRRRVEQLEERVTAPQKAVTTVRRASPSSIRPAPTPPFRIVGVELRGGERFLSLLPLAGTPLRDVHLLRPGEAEGVWRLQSIENDTAVFQINGQIQRVKFSQE